MEDHGGCIEGRRLAKLRRGTRQGWGWVGSGRRETGKRVGRKRNDRGVWGMLSGNGEGRGVEGTGGQLRGRGRTGNSWGVKRAD